MATRMQQRRGTAAQWISTNSGNGPVLNSGEIGFESDTNKFKIGDGVNHWINLDYFADTNSTVNPAFGSSITFEGATDNAFETTLVVTDPTADRTITLPNATGTIVLADGSGNVTVSGDLTVSGTTTTINSTTINATTGIVFEGATADAFETTLTVTDPTADRTLTLPNSTGTVATQEYVDSAVSGAATDESALAGTGLNWNAGTSKLDVDTTTIQAKVANVDDTEIGYLNGVTSAIQTQINTKAPTASPTFTGTLTIPSSIVVEGATEDDYETTLTFADPTQDRTITFPNNSGTVAFTSDISAATGGSVSETGTQTLTNKSISFASNTLTGTFAQFNTAVTDTDLLSVADPAVDYYITNSGSGAYLVNGVSNGTIYFEKGKKYRIHVNATGHPFWIQTSSGAYNSGNVYSTGITNNGTQSGHIIVELASNAPQLYYACEYHSSMAGSVITGTTFATYKALADLSNVDNTTDANKPVSTATQTALDLKLASATAASTYAPLASPALTGTATAVNLTVSGDLTVNGTTTNLNSTSLVVEDKNIVLGDTATPTDTTADGGGITLKGATDKTFNWVDATDAWTSSEHINLASGKTLKYNGTDLVASQTGNSGKYLTTDGTSTSWGTVSGYSAPTLGSTSIASGATVTTVAGLTLTAPTLTGTVVASGDINLSAANGPGSLIDELALILMGAL